MNSSLLRVIALSLLFALALPVLGVTQPSYAGAQTETDAEVFASYLQMSVNNTPVAGPLSGALAFDSSAQNTFSAGVDLSDQLIHFEVAVPSVGASDTWAVAVAFRFSDNLFHYLLFWSDGSWSFAPAGGGGIASGAGIAAGLPGKTMSFDIAIDGETGYAGVDGQFVTTLDLSSQLGSGDTVISANLIGTPALADGPLAFDHFTIWDLSAIDNVDTVSDQTPSDHLDEDAETVPSASPALQPEMDDESTFNTIMLGLLTRPVVFGPVNDSLVHSADEVSFYRTDVTVTDFIARVECIAPQTDADGFWDCGFVFRDTRSPDHFRIVYVSDGYWFQSIGSNESLQSGTDAPAARTPGVKVTLNLIVIGNDGYFGVDDQFVASLDLSGLQGPGSIDLASAFFNDTYIEGGSVAFEDLVVWSLDDSTSVAGATATEEPLVQPSATPQDQMPTPTSAADLPEVPIPTDSGVDGMTYTSPTYGYSLSWNENWSVDDENSDGVTDYLGLSSGVVVADLIGEPFDATAGSCFEQIVAYYEADPAYTDIQFATDSASTSSGIWDETGMLTMTFTRPDSGVATEFANFASCSVVQGGEASVSLEQFVPVADFRSQVVLMDELRDAFVLNVGTVALQPSPTMPASAPVQTPGPETQITGAAIEGNTYKSPAFGYQLTWNESWSVDFEDSADGIDFLALRTDTLRAELYASTGPNTSMQCIDDLLAFYQEDIRYPSAEFVTESDGTPLVTVGDESVNALISLTRIDEEGVTTMLYSDATCHRLDELGAVVIMEIYSSPSDYLLQQSAISELKSGFMLRPSSEVVQPENPIEATAGGETPEATDATSAMFFLLPVDGSGVQGTGTLDAAARTTTMTVIALGGSPGDVVTIHRSSCEMLDPLAEPDYIVGELDSAGVLRAEIGVRLPVLLTRDSYAVVIYAAGDELAQAVACGDIVG
ncbi:hypothetical protein BH23CHL5_BH23CHL5_12900 [soil metagenome]